jgi:hypothetical protein
MTLMRQHLRTKVQILTQQITVGLLAGAPHCVQLRRADGVDPHGVSAHFNQFTCCTSTKAQILTAEELSVRGRGGQMVQIRMEYQRGATQAAESVGAELKLLVYTFNL